MRPDLQGDPWLALSPTTLAVLALVAVGFVLMAFKLGEWHRKDQRKDDEP